MRYVVYGAGIVSVLAVTLLWVRLLWSWKLQSRVRYAKLGAVLLLTPFVVWFGSRVNRYRKINNLRDQLMPTIEFAVQHALRQPGTTLEEKAEMERRIRAGTEAMIEWQIDHE